MKTYYLHISYMAPLKSGVPAYCDALMIYKGGVNYDELRRMLRDDYDKSIVDRDKLPNIISIDILPKGLYKELTQRS